MMRHVTLLALPFLAIAGAAPAQERAPFTGLHVEAIVGGDRLQAGGHDDGLLYGVAGGYDLTLGSRVIAGIEGEATDSTQRECDTGFLVAGDRLCERTGRDLYIGGRIGTQLGANTLLYAKAGYTNARLTARYESGSATGSFRDRATLDGVRVGLGLEHRLGERTFGKAEYRYSNYEGGVARHQVLAGLGIRF